MNNEALKYLEMGFSVIPLGKITLDNKGQKKISYPISWTQFQTQRPSKEEVSNWTWINLGVVTGKISGIIVVDTDLYKQNYDEKLFKSFNIPVTPVQQTARGGRQYFFKHPGFEVRNSVSLGHSGSGIDIRADGGMTIIPPTKTDYGEYKWIISPLDVDFAELPQQIIEILKKNNTSTSKKIDNYTMLGVNEGERNSHLTSLTGSLINKYPRSKWLKEVFPLILAMNNSFNPPLDIKEVQSIYNSITKKELSKGEPTGLQKDIVIQPTVLPMEDKIVFVKSSEIISRPIDWLWEGKIAKGKVTMIAGDPGLGKSQVSLFLAGIVSTGGTFPGGYKSKQGSVLLFSAEDSTEDTINPRLQAVSADGSKIFIFSTVKIKDKEKFFDVSEDLPLLKKALESNRDISLIIIDPITAFLGETDSHKNSEVRGLLSVLSKIADEHHVAILIITHLNKNSGASAMNKITGSLAFVAAARAAYMVVKDQADESRRLFLTVKNNLAVDKGGFAYRVESVVTKDNISTSKVAWEDAPITMTLAEAMEDTKYENARGETIDWLENYLKKYPDGISFDLIEKEAGRQGVATRRSLDRAAEKLMIDKIYQGKGRPKLWKLVSFEDIDSDSVPI